MRELNKNPNSKVYSPFYTPITVMLKADSDDPYTVYIEASTESIDTQDDVTYQKALEEEAENFLKKGVISWDHQHKSEKSPEYIIGEPVDVKFTNVGTWVKAKLYKSVDYAKAVIDLLASGCTRLGASIGGYIQKREPLSEKVSAILKVIWDELAITYKPVNDDTRGNVSLIPIGAFQKALQVGSGVDASQFTGGRALVTESMQGNVVKQELDPKIQRIMEDLSSRIIRGEIQTAQHLKDFLEYHNALHLYTKLAKLLVKKLS